MRTFSEPDPELDACAAEVVAACLEVHRALGPGFLESIYEQAVCIELESRGVPFRRQVLLPIAYKGRVVGQHRIDILVAERLVVELKAVETLVTLHRLQVRSYLRATGATLGLLVNFNVGLLLQGVKRVILSSEGDA